MALAPGTQIGPYEVAEAVGSGGMGELYRATDTTLRRDVAIKVLDFGIPKSIDAQAVSGGAACCCAANPAASRFGFE